MSVSIYLSIITLSVLVLKSPIKRHRVPDWIKNKTHLYAAYKRLISELKTQTESEGMDKDISCK